MDFDGVGFRLVICNVDDEIYRDGCRASFVDILEGCFDQPVVSADCMGAMPDHAVARVNPRMVVPHILGAEDEDIPCGQFFRRVVEIRHVKGFRVFPFRHSNPVVNIVAAPIPIHCKL